MEPIKICGNEGQRNIKQTQDPIILLSKSKDSQNTFPKKEWKQSVLQK